MLEENRHGAAKFPFFARFYIGHIFEKTVLPKVCGLGAGVPG